MASSNGQKPLHEVVARIESLLAQLVAEERKERAEARWSRRADMPHVTSGGGGHSDPSWRGMVAPDPTNTARADECERAIRRAYSELERRRHGQPRPARLIEAARRRQAEKVGTWGG